jgi:FK506-binding nuclear protein
MFFAVQLEPNKAYQQEVEEPFRVSMASLGEIVKGNKRCSVVVTVNGEKAVLCNLIPEKIEQQQLDIVFSEGEDVTFEVTGENTVFLTGNMMDDMPMGLGDEESINSEDIEEEDLEAEMVGEDGKEDEEDDVEEEEDDDDDEIDEEGDEDDDELDEEEQEEMKRIMAEIEKERANNAAKKRQNENVSEKKENKKAKTDNKQQQPLKQAETTTPAEGKKEKKVLPNGLEIIDDVVGKGAKAKNGKRVFMRYIGKLTNGKKFDENTSGKPFSFVLGKGEVIKGWDIGIQGMQVGGTRKLVIPAKLAYGSAGAPPDIPKNATLTFDVKLLDVK